MKKKLLSAVSLICVAAMLYLGALPALALGASSEMCDVMIYADEEHFEDILAAREALCELAGDIEIIYTYTHALFGFWARIGTYQLELIDASPYFDAHVCGSFSPLSYKDEGIYDTSSMYASEMLGVTEAHTEGYTGAGTVVAVIDDGFDVTHEVFAGSCAEPSLTREAVSDMIATGELNASKLARSIDGIYVSEKIPFAFDYSTGTTDVSTLESHGTHVSAVIGGKSEVMTGVAPDCQLILMKVFSETVSKAAEQLVAAALEDAITLGADVINLSLGTYSGSTEASPYSSIDRMAKKLKNAGITVVCAAGNDGSSAYTSSYAEYLDSPYPRADMPDIGTINHPAVVESFVAVASAGNTHIKYNTLVHRESDGSLYRIEYTDTNASFGIINKTFVDSFDNSELEYVCVSGVGKSEELDSLDLTGKLALIERGEITFVEKVNNAAARGAVGVIVFDNTEDEPLSMELSGCKIPAVFISKKDGEYLASREKKTLVFDNKLSRFDENPSAYEMSEFSSWGTTPSFGLKPDLTAVGESVFSASPGNTYTSLTGTSMATPFVSGIAALICERLEREQSKYILSKRVEYIKALLMTTAGVLHAKDGVEYSPRRQGAGLASISAALESELLMSSTEGESVLYLEREDDGGLEYASELIIENLTERELELELDAVVLRDESFELEALIKGEKTTYTLNSLTSRRLDKASIIPTEDSGLESAGQGKYKLKLGAGKSCSIEFKIRLDADELKENDVFENGYFVDGYIFINSGTRKYSAPFIGFSTDFSSADIFDDSVYELEHGIPFYTGNALMSKKYDGTMTLLGTADGTIFGANGEYAAFSPKLGESSDELYLAPSLLRNISSYKVEIFDPNGELIHSIKENEPLTKGGAERHEPIYIWDGGDGIFDGYIFSDGSYSVVFTAYSDDGKTNQSITMPVKIDTAAPRVAQTSVEQVEEKLMLTVAAQDNVKVKSVRLYTLDKEEPFDLLELDDGDDIFVFDLSALKSEYVWADITDYASNKKTAKIYVTAD